jgi:CubicO group peptidase (beta-lactamase class C family)
MKWKLVLALLAGVAICGVDAVSAAEAAGDVDAQIAHIAQSVPAGVLGRMFGGQTLARRMQIYHASAVSIAVIDDYKIKWARGFGVVAPGSTIAVTDKTLFQAGSISKTVAAVGILRLVDNHRLSLDDHANDRLRSWKLPENDFTKNSPVTIVRLLSHTADTTVHGFPGYERDVAHPTLAQVLDGAPPTNTPPIRVEAVPGSRWQYSGGGYLILQQIAIDTTHQTFPDFMREQVLRPAGMQDSTYEQPLPPALQSRATCGVWSSGQVVKRCWHVYPEMAAAGLWDDTVGSRALYDTFDARSRRTAERTAVGRHSAPDVHYTRLRIRRLYEPRARHLHRWSALHAWWRRRRLYRDRPGIFFRSGGRDHVQRRWRAWPVGRHRARHRRRKPLAGLRPIGTGLQRDGAASAERRGPAQLSP